MMDWNEQLKHTTPLSKEWSQHVRQAALLELREGKPIVPWSEQWVWILSALFGGVFLVEIILVAVGQTEISVAASHWPALAMLAATLAISTIGAVRPKTTMVLPVVVFGFLAMAFLRQNTNYQSASPEWLCTVSHLGADVLPFFFALKVLRDFAPNPKRTILMGLGAGVVGAMLGEMVCQRGPLHLAIYHLSAWAILTAAVTLAARWIKHRSFSV